MIDESIEKEKKIRNISEKATVKAASSILIILFFEVFLLAGFLCNGIGRTLTAAAVFIVFDIFYFFIAIEVIMNKHMKVQYPAAVSFLNVFRRKRFMARVSAAPTAEEKLRLYNERLKKAAGQIDKISAACEYIDFAAIMRLDRNADAPYETLLKIHPRKILLKITKFQAMLKYYILKEDSGSYIRAFEENSGLICEGWNYSLFAKLDIIPFYIQYYEFKKEYQKALEYYDVMLDFRKRAYEIDVSLGLTDELLNVSYIDYANLYCMLGNFEEGKKYFRMAEERLSDNDTPYIKKQMENVRKMLEEANNNLSL